MKCTVTASVATLMTLLGMCGLAIAETTIEDLQKKARKIESYRCRGRITLGAGMGGRLGRNPRRSAMKGTVWVFEMAWKKDGYYSIESTVGGRDAKPDEEKKKVFYTGKRNRQTAWCYAVPPREPKSPLFPKQEKLMRWDIDRLREEKAGDRLRVAGLTYGWPSPIVAFPHTWLLALDPASTEVESATGENGEKVYEIKGSLKKDSLLSGFGTSGQKLKLTVGRDGFPRRFEPGMHPLAMLSGPPGMKVKYGEVELNPDLPEELFEFNPPEGVEVHDRTEKLLNADKR